MTTTTETGWWEPLGEAHRRLNGSSYVAPYVNFHKESSSSLFGFATYLREVADLVEQGARLVAEQKEQPVNDDEQKG